MSNETREYGVTECSEECRRFIASKPTIDWMWTVAQMGRLANTQGDDPSFCAGCDSKFGIDERGPWRQRMVPAAERDHLREELTAVGFAPFHCCPACGCGLRWCANVVLVQAIERVAAECIRCDWRAEYARIEEGEDDGE